MKIILSLTVCGICLFIATDNLFCDDNQGFVIPLPITQDGYYQAYNELTLLQLRRETSSLDKISFTLQADRTAFDPLSLLLQRRLNESRPFANPFKLSAQYSLSFHEQVFVRMVRVLGFESPVRVECEIYEPPFVLPENFSARAIDFSQLKLLRREIQEW